MLPGPTKILKIPLSGTLVKVMTIVSGNTFGARHWTDGKREAPMMPDAPWLRRHSKTGELFWTNECDIVGEEPPWGDDDKYGDVGFAETPTMDDYRAALDAGVASTPEKQRYVLMRYWWNANDPVRHGKSSGPPPSDLGERLRQLRALLDPTDPNQRLMSAEVSRQLGDFLAADLLLDFEFPGGSRAVAFIKKLTKEGNSALQEILD